MPKSFLTGTVDVALRLYLGLHAATDRDVQVRRRQFQPPGFGTHEYIGENRQGGSRANDVLNGLQPIDKLLLCDGQVHAVLIVRFLSSNQPYSYGQ